MKKKLVNQKWITILIAVWAVFFIAIYAQLNAYTQNRVLISENVFHFQFLQNKMTIFLA